MKATNYSKTTQCELAHVWIRLLHLMGNAKVCRSWKVKEVAFEKYVDGKDRDENVCDPCFGITFEWEDIISQ